MSGGADAPSADLFVGSVVEVDIGPIAHGGHAVARHEGRVIFVRHAIPGERVRAVITEGGDGARFLRADAVDILEASADRVEPPCPHAAPGACGGCDFQHITLTRQRELLGEVIAEQLQRLAGIEWPVSVEAVPGDQDGLRWRTRVRYAATADRLPGLRKHRSHDVVPIDDCRIASPRLPDVTDALGAGVEWAEAVVSSTGTQAVVMPGGPAPVITEEAAGRSWSVSAGDFWQVHPGAADALTSAVIEGLAPQPGERCWDLYAGVGLMAGALGEIVGESGGVVAVEGHGRSARHARDNLADLAHVRVISSAVESFVKSRMAQGRLDLVVLDPPRAGAKRDVVRAIARQQPRAVAYVACDPSSLARDVATLADVGYVLTSLRAFDIFPMTSHVECVALLVKSDAGLR